mmetsp:Transcript_4970/g.9983  ORF Transcript_4970/g.9983 Transcript_4970/m.9983 type:complete len:1063 (-) Transcript_4970:458-3646(-)
MDTEVAASVAASWGEGFPGHASLSKRGARGRTPGKKRQPTTFPVPAPAPMSSPPPTPQPFAPAPATLLQMFGPSGPTGAGNVSAYAGFDQVAALRAFQKGFVGQKNAYNEAHRSGSSSEDGNQTAQVTSDAPQAPQPMEEEAHVTGEALDIFWNMVMTEDDGKSINGGSVADDSSFLGDLDGWENEEGLDVDEEDDEYGPSIDPSELEGEVEEHLYDEDMPAAQMPDLQGKMPIPPPNRSDLQKQYVAAPLPTPAPMPSAPASVYQPMPSIVDFTPEAVVVPPTAHGFNVKVVVSVSSHVDFDPIAYQNASFSCGTSGEWRLVVAFLSCGTSSTRTDMPILRHVDVSVLNKITPQTYKCQVPFVQNKTWLGPRRLLIGALRVIRGCKGGRLDLAGVDVLQTIRDAVGRVWHTTSRKINNFPEFSYRGSLAFDSSDYFIPLSQLSSDIFYFKSTIPTNEKERTENLQLISGPAPPSAMASIATALCDFANPPTGTVVHNVSTLFHQTTKTNTQGIHRKRTANWCDSAAIGIRDANVSDTQEILDANMHASVWASGMPTQGTSVYGNVSEEVDRHCKIRFVEKMNNVLFSQDNNSDRTNSYSRSVGSASNMKISDDKSSIKSNDDKSVPSGGRSESEEGTGSAGSLDDDCLEKMNDDELDTMLDKQLIKVVEALVEMTASDAELQNELNAPDQSGFALLHYAALYNLRSLVPILLSRGSHPDIPTQRGGLTALQLAAGAGNERIVEILLRSGANIDAKDGNGANAADYALRNGFKNVYKLLKKRYTGSDIMNVFGGSDTSSHTDSSTKSPSQPLADFNPLPIDPETKRHMLQMSFQNLTFKDKLAINMLLRKYKGKMPKPAGGGKTKYVPTTPITGPISECEEYGSESKGGQLPSGHRNADTSRFFEHSVLASSGQSVVSDNDYESDNSDDDVASYISETDQMHLDVAMKLMNHTELEDLEQSAMGISSDVRKWILKRNYYSLKEVSQFLSENKSAEKQKGKKGKGKISKQSSSTTSTARMNVFKPKDQKSLKNFKSQVLSELVIRKNLQHVYSKSKIRHSRAN